ncbi:MFS transporter [Treponema sp.]|uniref:MFS transporter n=1 Tax=Treponema sp. TaxID=166 RepID=UPI003F0AAB8F
MSEGRKVNVMASSVSGVSGLIITVVLVGLGERIGERFLPVYLVATGASLFAPSVLNALDNFLSAVYSFPGGWISSKVGYKKALLYFNIFAIIGYLIVIIFPGWIAVIVGSVFFLSWSSLSMPAYMDLIRNEIPKNKQVFGISVHSLIKRVPMALGPLLGGVLVDKFGIQNGIRIAFVIATACSVAGIFVQQSAMKNSVIEKKSEPGFPRILPWQFPRDMQVILVSDILAKFCSQIPYAYIAIWAMEYSKGAKISATLFGTLTTIEMVCAISSYVIIAFLGDRFKKKSFVLTTFILYALFPIVLLGARSFPILIAAFVIRGFKEFGEPARKAQIMDFAPEGQKALYFGAFYLYRDIFVTLGVFLGGALWLVCPELNLIVASAFGIVSCLVYAVKGK